MLDPLSFKRKLLLGMFSGLYWSGIAEVYRRGTRSPGAIILMYHSVADRDHERFIAPSWHMTPEAFEKQIQFLARHRKVISLSYLVEEIVAGRDPPTDSVVITFDDGYLDNLTHAAPILAKYGVPATVFLPTGVIDSGINMWVDELHTGFHYRTKELWKDEKGRSFRLSNDEELRAAFRELSSSLIGASPADQRKVLRDLEDQLRPKISVPRLMMNWQDVKELSEKYPLIDIGVHTVTHCDMSQQKGAALSREIRESVERVQEQLGKRPEHFAFPYNRSSDEACRILEAEGLRCGVAVGEECRITKNADRYQLPRMDAKMADTLLRFTTSSAYPSLTKLVFNRQL